MVRHLAVKDGAPILDADGNLVARWYSPDSHPYFVDANTGFVGFFGQVLSFDYKELPKHVSFTIHLLFEMGPFQIWGITLDSGTTLSDAFEVQSHLLHPDDDRLALADAIDLVVKDRMILSCIFPGADRQLADYAKYIRDNFR
jgi:hypothetical protein